MEFEFNEKKAAQAAAYLLRRRGPLTYGQLVKLLYLADRRKLLERGTPITGDQVASMEHGLILSTALNLMRFGAWGRYGAEWHRHVSHRKGQNVRAIADDTDELSKYELHILDAIDTQYGHMTFTQLRNVTHGLREYRDAGNSSTTIEPEHILEAAGQSAEQIAEVGEKADALLAIDRLSR